MFTLFNSLHCCSLICPANHHSRRPKSIHGEMLSWTPWDSSGLESCFMHHIIGSQPWWQFLVVTPGGYDIKGWTTILGRSREKSALCHMGSLRCVRLLKMIFPYFSLKLLERCNGNRWREGHIFHQVGFLCAALIVCVSDAWMYVVWKGYLLAAICNAFSFSQAEKQHYKLKWGIN